MLTSNPEEKPDLFIYFVTLNILNMCEYSGSDRGATCCRGLPEKKPFVCLKIKPFDRLLHFAALRENLLRE